MYLLMHSISLTYILPDTQNAARGGTKDMSVMSELLSVSVCHQRYVSVSLSHMIKSYVCVCHMPHSYFSHDSFICDSLTYDDSSLAAQGSHT